ncbi:MAG TPA: UdgX family uracil-DNA binding protein [Rhodocyclaceae bacterium]|nr:UdgX family uracil-DNA binding protein [Rhodocyclaceae bacterium]
MATSLDDLEAEARGCRACPLWLHATQTVFGEGNPQARVVLVGEQPGDAEDVAGRPFVGPAGKILDRALEDAEIERDEIYVTNAVKHFKWEPRGKRRMHKTPAQQEIAACHRWIESELEAIQPALVVCLGATAVHALIGKDRTVSSLRGRIIERPAGPAWLVTVHPSYILRVPPQVHGLVYQSFVADLRLAQPFVGAGQAP